MPAEYPRPPEAELLYLARSGQHLSIREAARRAGISENRWRQVEAGYQTVRKGVRVPANATAATLASMARAVGLTPDRLEAEGQRPDAAGILREMQHQHEAAVPRLSRVRDDKDAAHDSTGRAVDAELAASALFLPVLQVRLAEMAGHGNHHPDGAEEFLEGGDPLDAGEDVAEYLAEAWDIAMNAPVDLDTAARLVARAWVRVLAYKARKASGAAS